MKKRTIICLTVSIMLLLQSVFVCQAETADALDYSDFQSATRLLSVIGVTEGIDFDSQAENLVTRYEFALLITRILGADVENYSSNTVFNDVSEEQYNIVAYIYDNKIMVGNGNGSFEPDRYITVNEAFKTLVCVLGYDVKAYLNGNTMQSYVQLAKKIGLTDDIAFHKDDRIQYKYIARIFYNALKTHMYEQTLFGDSERYEETDDTLLYRYFGIKFAEGIIEANDISAVSGSLAPGGMVRVDGINYHTGETNASQLLGYNVTVYYDAESTSNRIILVDESELSSSVRLDANDTDFDNMEYEYYVNEKTKKLKVSKSASIVLNGMVTAYSKDIMVPSSGYINLVDTNNDNRYELVVIEDEKVEISDGYNSLNEKIGLKYDRGSIDLSKYDEDRIHIYNANGSSSKASELSEWTVLTIIKNPYEIFIYKSTEKINGEVNQIKSDPDNIVTIDENDYQVSDAYLSANNSKIELGNNGTFYVDRHKSIVAFRTNGSEWIYAYLIGTKCDNNGFDNICKVKMFTTAGKGSLGVFDMAESFVIDGEKCSLNGAGKSSGINRFAALTDLQLIRYKSNSEGYITNIETTASGEYKRVYPSADDFTRVKYNYNTFASLCAIGDNTKVIVVPNEQEDQDAGYNYLSTGKEYFSNARYYKIKAYREVSDNIVSNVVLVKRNDIPSSPLIIGVVDSVSETLNSDGDEAIKANIMKTDGTLAEVYFKDMNQYEHNEIEPYDIVRLTLNGTNSIEAIEKLYDCDTGDANTSYCGANVNLDSECALLKSRILDRSGNYVIVKNLLKDNDAEPNVFDAGETVVIICEKSNDKGIRFGSIHDLEDYNHFGTECVAISYVNYYKLRYVVIYK